MAIKKSTTISVDNIASVYIGSWNDRLEISCGDHNFSERTEFNFALNEEQLRAIQRQVNDRLKRLEEDRLEKAKEQVEEDLKNKGEI